MRVYKKHYEKPIVGKIKWHNKKWGFALSKKVVIFKNFVWKYFMSFYIKIHPFVIV